MTSPQEQFRDDFTINLTTDADRNLAKVMFQDRPGLANTFAKCFNVQFTNMDENKIYCLGSKETESKSKRAFAMLTGAFTSGMLIDKKLIKKMESEINPQPADGLAGKFAEAANQNTPQKKGAFVARSAKQQLQSDLIDGNDIIFSVGPAGTGKTHVAMIKAVQALQAGKVKKILLARPALESGEKLGFQPGDQNAKMAPYMRPLYDELDKAYGPGKYKGMIESQVIEIVPIGFMRGRTFENAFIIVDEAQNCKFENLKMAITRLGPGSKMVITGDPEQVDLEPRTLSGLKPLMEKLDGVEGVAIQLYDASDVVRHPTVKRIIDRLEPKEQQSPAVNVSAGPKN